MCATFNNKPCTTIVSCHSSVIASAETDITTFYNGLSSLGRHILKNNALISRDINAQIGGDENNKFCLHNLPKRNGEYLSDFALEISLSYRNITFQKGKKEIEREKPMDLHLPK